jgi:hypothetical protein
MANKIDYHKIPDWAQPGTDNIVEEVRWWEAQNLPWQLIKELRRRSNTSNIGQNSSVDIALNFKKHYSSYRGPMTPWVRAFSNGTGRVINESVPHSNYLLKNNAVKTYNGFLLQGGDGFGNAYGFSIKNGIFEPDKAVLGYEADGKPHYIDTKYRNHYNYSVSDDRKFPQNNMVPSVLPPPGIVSVDINTNKEMMSTAKINWKCYSLAQLEYMAPFWLSPKINVFLEFGWNLYNIDSLLNLSSPDECYEYIIRPERALENYYKSFGNYGLLTGIIKEYNFNTEDGFVYNCTTEIISRQAMYAGYRIDNPTTTTEGGKDSREYTTLKEFLSKNLQHTKAAIKNRQNFIKFVASLDKKNEGGGTTPPTSRPIDHKKFYGGKKEDRIFAARSRGLYNKLPVPANMAYTADALEYGTATDTRFQNPQSYKVISYGGTDLDFDKFDQNGVGNDEVWYQLDFIFEIINLFCAEPGSNNNRIDISDIIISAHPNLISCDKNVLIPNPSAPKINFGKPESAGGFLFGDAGVMAENQFLNQIPWETISAENPPKYSKKAKDVFKTGLLVRDNLDAIINYLYYHHINKNNNKNKDAAFPFKQDKPVGKNTYKAKYNGYLKHIYISKTEIINACNDPSILTLQQFVNKILNVVNAAVDNFWNLEIVQNPTDGGLSIIDKNLSLRKGSELYMFDVASTRNVIKNISFNVTLTNEQTNQVLYGSGQNEIKTLQEINEISKGNGTTDAKITKLTQLQNGIPSIVYRDRFDELDLRKRVAERIKELQNQESDDTNIVPHGPFIDRNSEIEALQKHGKQTDEVLVMRTLMIHEDELGKNYVQLARGIEESKSKFNWTYLNLPPSMKGRLRQMIDDGDIENNTSTYAGPADNFTITITFDGIMGFRMFQHFAIANLPKPYVPGNVIFMISEVEHKLSAGKWETIVTAMLRCAPNQNYKYIYV